MSMIVHYLQGNVFCHQGLSLLQIAALDRQFNLFKLLCIMGIDLNHTNKVKPYQCIVSLSFCVYDLLAYIEREKHIVHVDRCIGSRKRKNVDVVIR
jgi:hypothetical protein